MQIHEQQQGAVAVLRPDGQINSAEAPTLRARFQDAARQNMGRVVLDLAGVPFVDSAGLEALSDAGQLQGESGRVLCLVGANATLREVFELTGLADQFEYFEDVQAAVRSFM